MYYQGQPQQQGSPQQTVPQPGAGQSTQGAPQPPGSLMQPFYLGTPPQMNATYSSFNTDPSQLFALINQGFAPQAATEQKGFMDQMAASGLPPGMMAPEFAAQQTAAMAPTFGQAAQFAQGQGLNQSEFNAGNANQAALQNVMDVFNAQQFNANAGNQAREQQFNAFQGVNNAGLGGQLNLAQQYGQNYPVMGGLGGAFSQFGQQVGGLFGPRTQPMQPAPPPAPGGGEKGNGPSGGAYNWGSPIQYSGGNYAG